MEIPGNNSAAATKLSNDFEFVFDMALITTAATQTQNAIASGVFFTGVNVRFRPTFRAIQAHFWHRQYFFFPSLWRRKSAA
jgi:hypothetical protein